MAYRYESPTIAWATRGLALIGLGCVAAMTFLAWERTPVPDALASIGGGAVGALATLLTTFTPSPVPGGRRLADSVTTTTTHTEIPSTPGPAPDTLNTGNATSGKGGSDG